MRILLSGDLHLSNKPYSDSLERSHLILDGIARIAKSQECETIIINGDLFDVENPPPEVFLMAVRFCRKMKKQGRYVIINTGNHDLIEYGKSHKLTLLEALDAEIVWKSPLQFKDRNTTFHIFPWEQHSVFKKKLTEYTLGIKSKGSHILVAHQATNEGVISASNRKVRTNLSWRDMHPEFYKLVLLSDYHKMQFLADNVIYLGSPVPHDFGDDGCEGVSVFDTESRELEGPFPLPGRFAEFVTWELEDEEVALLNYDPKDYNRIICADKFRSYVREVYPEAQIITRSTKRTDSRLSECETEGDVESIWKGFLKTKDWETKKEYNRTLKIGKNLLAEVTVSD